MTQIEYIPGDWIKASGQLCRVEEVFVNRLTKEYEYTLIYPNGNSSRIVIGEIEPIPLTPEILEKNGWKEDRGDYIHKDHFLILCKKYDSYSAYESINDSNIVSLRDIKYVSDLQHLLFGIDIDSELKI